MRSELLRVLLILVLVLVIRSLLRRWLAGALDVCRGQFSDLRCWGRWWCEPPKLHEDILHLFPGLSIPLPFLAYFIPIELAIRNLISRLAPDKFARPLDLLQRGEMPLEGGSHNPWIVGFEGK